MSWQSKQFAKSWINYYSRKDTNHHIKGSDTAANRRTLVIVPFSIVIDDRLGSGRLDTFTTTVNIEKDLNTAANWDSVDTDYTVEVNRAGKDFYYYACIQPGTVPKILLSANSTYPTGYTANNSRKIGGFHAMPGACVNLPSEHPYKDFEAGAIHFNSIWDLIDRPQSLPDGMAKISLTPSDGLPALWVDIYLAAGNGTLATSLFGATIADNIRWMDFVDYGGLQRKRMLTDSEFSIAATGSNEETNIAGSVDPGTVTFPLDTAGRSMISHYGIIGMCGAMQQWLQDYAFQFSPDGTTRAASATATIYYAAEPSGNAIYVKYLSDGTPYLCCNMGTDAVDKWVTFGTYYRVLILHDANAAVGGVQVYYDYDAAAPAQLLATLSRGVSAYIETNYPDYQLKITYNASPNSVGIALYYDDGTDERLEAIVPSSANGTLDLARIAPSTASLDLNGSKGSIYQYGTTSELKMTGGGSWDHTTTAGSRCRHLDRSRNAYSAAVGCRFCSEAV
jgi:hypothetical protein